MSSHGVFHVAAFNVLPQIAPLDHNFIACPIETTDAQIGHWAYRGFSKTSADPYTFQGPVVQSPISTNHGLTLNKTYGVNPGLAFIGL